MQKSLPLLYSFRRCPYAMRARMALYSAGIQVDIVEVALKEKPKEMLALSAKGTVPVLLLEDGRVLDESLAIMDWALARNDPDNWLPSSLPDEEKKLHVDLIAENDSTFKSALDRYKYPQRFPEQDCANARNDGLVFLTRLDARLSRQPCLFGQTATYADIAIFPFVRQFANTDFEWLKNTSLTYLRTWLDNRVNSEPFLTIMEKHRSRFI